MVHVRLGWLTRPQSTERGTDVLDFVVRDQEVVDRAAADLLERVAGDQLTGSVEANEATVRVDDADERAGRVEHGIEPALVGSRFAG